MGKNYNKVRWEEILFRIPFGKGACLRVVEHGRLDNDYSYTTFDIQKSNDYKHLPQRRKGVMESVYKHNLIQNTGVCWLCGEMHPLVLQRHHLIEQRKGNTGREDFVCGICANCHEKRKSTKIENHQIAILKAIDKEWFGGDNIRR